MFEAHILEGLCRTIGDTTDGLTGAEIGQVLLNSNIPDIDSQNTKWKRLYSAFVYIGDSGPSVSLEDGPAVSVIPGQ